MLRLPAMPSYSKEMKMFMFASLLNAAGSSLMWPIVSMYVFDELGRSMADAGLALLVHSLGMIGGQLVGGALYYRVGVRPLIVGSLLVHAAGLGALAFAGSSWPLFLALLSFIGWFNAMAMPAIQSFIGFRFPERRAEMFNAVYVANNIGVAVGTAASGFLAELSYAFSFAANGAASAAFAVFFLLYLRKAGAAAAGDPSVRKSAGSAGNAALLANLRLYLLLALAGLLLNLSNSVWNAGVSPFLISEGSSKSAYGLLWTLNGVLIFVAQPLIGLLRRKIATTYTAQMTASAILYAAGFACFLALPNYPGLVLGMILATFGEMLIAPAVPAFLSEAGGKDAPFYLGLAGGVGSAGRVVGPYAMGSLYDGGGLAPVAWLAVAAAAGAAALYYGHARWNRPSRRAAERVSANISS
ncbi:MFS transporter [Paenibacillus sp.]|uniref:MFS transporter n=1 Tax=Paenibacillus sp. TaxID=58172 RepID=UPI002D429B2C|nr:MFS transporter [Paenibacillus sp.]HZG56448.1 MFS transporter [Paenibacillus sp.]